MDSPVSACILSGTTSFCIQGCCRTARRTLSLGPEAELFENHALAAPRQELASLPVHAISRLWLLDVFHCLICVAGLTQSLQSHRAASVEYDQLGKHLINSNDIHHMVYRKFISIRILHSVS